MSDPGASLPEELRADRSPAPGWPWWTGILALLVAFVLAALASLIVDLPAVALGANLTSSHTPAGLTIADTFLQDLAFVGASVYCAGLGGRMVRSWQFGLRAPLSGWRSAAGMVTLLLVAFLLLNVIWAEVVHPEKEKLLQQLGSGESGLLLVLSAGLTCVIAPIGEEFLFRGAIFTSLRRFGTAPAALVTGLMFGGVHATSAPIADLLPLAALGVGLCLLYRYTGSLYPGIVAHALNNSWAFASLEEWVWWKWLVLMVAALAAIWLVVAACKRVGLIATGRGLARSAA